MVLLDAVAALEPWLCSVKELMGASIASDIKVAVAAEVGGDPEARGGDLGESVDARGVSIEARADPAC